MKVTFLILSILGFTFFIIGIKNLINIANKKIIREFKLTEEPNKIYFPKIGVYSICFTGGKSITNTNYFSVTISKDNLKLNIYEKLLKFRFSYKNNFAVESYSFNITETGEYKIHFNNIKDLSIKDSILHSKAIFQKKKPIENINVLIKETFSSYTFIFSLLSTIFGILISIWSLIFF